MSLQLIRAVAAAENTDELHLSRLLVLLHATGGRKGSKSVEGITKLAKLDFLLRYPTCLERALSAIQDNPEKADVKQHERNSIESKMIRFRYGPWDGRYRRWIGLLVARGLADTYIKGNTVHVALTDRGREVAATIAALDEFQDIEARSGVIASKFGGYSATAIKTFIYKVFPEIITMKWGEDINL